MATIRRSTSFSKNSALDPLLGCAHSRSTERALYRCHLCGYDLNLTYPQNGHFPTLHPQFNEDEAFLAKRKQSKASVFKQLLKQDVKERRAGVVRRSTLVDEKRYAKREQWKRDLTGRPNGTLDPWYQCDVYFEMVEYALNFSLPWSMCRALSMTVEYLLGWFDAEGNDLGGFDIYQIPDALDPEAPMDAGVFLNSKPFFDCYDIQSIRHPHTHFCPDDKVRAAIHAPTSKNWIGSIDNYPFSAWFRYMKCNFKSHSSVQTTRTMVLIPAPRK